VTTDDHSTADAAVVDGVDQADPGKSRQQLPLWQETILLLGIALVLAILIKALFVQAFYIPSESMEPGLIKDDRILVQKVSYWGSGRPERGDVVVFKDPNNWLGGAAAIGPDSPVTKAMAKVGLYPEGGHLVKRVIGVAGDVIECCDAEGRLMVNDESIDEPYARVTESGGVPRETCAGPMTRTCEWTAGPVPEGKVFVLGDNRWHSADSSVHMCPPKARTCQPGEEFVPTDLVVGKVFVLLWPRDRMGWIRRPDTFAAVPGGS
jgi:signal peptidase I